MRVTLAKLAAAATFRASVTLTDAQIKALDTGTLPALPALGPGLVALPVGGIARIRNAAAPYTNLGPGPFDQTWFIGWAGLPFIFFQLNDPGVSGLGTAGDWVVPNETGSPAPVSLATLANAPLVLGAIYDFAGSLTGGNAANSATITFDYRVVPV